MALTRVSGGILQQPIDVGIITATSIQVGSGTTIHDAGIDLGSGNLTSHNINSTGIVTSTGLDVNGNGDISGDLSVSGNVSIGGTLTYEDVTNIDSVGLITARDGIIVTGGSVGIGTDNPSAYFSDANDIVLQKTDDCGITIASGTSQKGTIAFADGTTGDQAYRGYIQYNHSTDSLQVATTGTEALRITSTGDVGIGTDTPTSFGPTLQVAGTDPALLLQDTATAVDYFGVNVTSGITQLWYDDAAAFTINTASGISGSGLVERLRITSNGLVGIGTDDTPTAKLDVFEAVTSTQTAIRIGNTNTPSTANNKRLEFVDGTGTTEGTNKFTYGYIQGYREGGSNAGALIFGTKPDNAGSPAEKFRITSSGKVGIGTNNPNHVFELRKDSALTGAGQYPAIQISNANASGYSQITFTSGQGTSETAGIVAYNGDNSLRFRTNGGTERLRITSDGTFYLGGYLESTTNNNTVKKIAVAPYNWTGGSTAEIASIEMGAPNTGSDDGNIIFKTATNVDTGGTLDERFRVSSNGKIHIGYDASSSAGTDQVNIVAAGGGINICRTQGGSPAINEWLGALGFKGYASGNSSSGADARIHAKAAAAHSGTSAGADLIFSTKPVTTGPGSAPTERMSITAAGQIRTGQININAFSNQDNDIGGYTQIACDNHANTFFGQNLKLGASSGSGNYTLEVINQHSSIGGAGMYIGGNGNSSRINAVTFYAVAANQSPGTNVTNMDRLRITDSNTYFWTQPTNYNSSAQTYTRTFGFTFNMADGEEEVMFYNPDSYRRIYYQIYIQSGHGSNGYGYILCNTSRYGTDFHVVDWHVSLTTYAHASSVNGNVNYNGVKLVRNGTYGTITYYVIVKAFSPAGGNPFSTSGLTDASYRYYSQGF